MKLDYDAKIAALETENAALKTKLQEIYPDWQSSEHYKVFDTLLSKEEASNFTYKYEKANKTLKVYLNNTNFNASFMYYLCIFRDMKNKPHYVSISYDDRLFTFDDIYNIYGRYNEAGVNMYNGDDSGLVVDLNLPNMRGPLNFDAVYAGND